MTRHAFALVRPLAAVLLSLAAGCSRTGAPDAGDHPTVSADHASATSAACVPRVHDAWVRLVPGGDMPMDAGYAVIDNPCDTPAVITGATSPAYADVTLHESAMADGMSRMRPVAALRIDAHRRVELAPGGYHLMLMAPRARPTVGQRVTITFQLQDGRTVGGSFEARPLTP